MNEFERRLDLPNGKLTCIDLETLQVNLGFRCNKSCSHCHVQAGPDRTESMTWETMKAIISLADAMTPSLVDLTGGAPEMNPHLGEFIETLREAGHRVQARTNLTALLEPWGEQFIQIYSDHGVKLVASLPCYEAAEVDSVRGDGTFDDSVVALQRLNEAGYGRGGELELDLVFNPEGAFLPPEQSMLEGVFHEKLKREHGIVFDSLITIANMPVGRFTEHLKLNGMYEEYMELLRETYNPETRGNLMCRHQLSVGWDGALFDCDFNLALGMPMAGAPNVSDPGLDLKELRDRRIVTGVHCFGCTAGQGSSCSGALSG